MKKTCKKCGKLLEVSYFDKSKNVKDGYENKCDGCGKMTLTTPYKIETQKYIFCSKECYKENIGQFYKGENNNFFNPNLTDEERTLRRNYTEYYKWRLDVYKRDRYTCQCCGDSKGHNLVAHHILNYSSYKDLRTELSNGITLCEKCHKKFHDTFGYTKNNNEQLITFLTNENHKAI